MGVNSAGEMKCDTIYYYLLFSPASFIRGFLVSSILSVEAIMLDLAGPPPSYNSLFR